MLNREVAVYSRLLLVFCCSWVSSVFALKPDGEPVGQEAYVGAERCATCHVEQYRLWQESDHFRSMQPAAKNTVLGDFDEKRLVFHGIASRLYSREGDYFIQTEGQSKKQQEFRIDYTFGHYPLQQYLVDIGQGHLQALNIAWDSRQKQEGGQRWFHLQPDEQITAEHPFYWTRHFQNWNNRCADCHSTNYQKKYDPLSHSYQSTWSEVNVACEACHGPAAKHVEIAEAKKLTNVNSGFSRTASEPLRWQFDSDNPIASAKGSANDDDVDTCGRCHSLRSRLTVGSQEDYHDGYFLQLLGDGSYFDDGQIREEAFVLGSFLQSKMHAKGVSCSNCHNPHSGKLLLKGNGLCAQCHSPETYDTRKHHHHRADSNGAACVNCHMPARTYMQVDNRRDHSFTIPRPDLSESLDLPNACVSCHSVEAEKDNRWAGKVLTDWGIKSDSEHWATVNRRAQLGDILVTRSLTGMVEDGSVSGIVKASLLDQLSGLPSRVSVDTAKKALKNDNPLIRRAAVNSLGNLPPQLRWQLLSPYLNDGQGSVRFEIARVLADLLAQLPTTERDKLITLIAEYRTVLKLNEDSPATQLSLANLELRLGNVEAAGAAYERALKIEPNYVPAMINMADYYRETQREHKVEPLLLEALNVAPDSGAAHHSYALFLIRKQNYRGALPYLKAALAQADAQPRFAYVYAVALESNDQLDVAVNALVSANERWPNQYDLLMLLIGYLEKSGNTMSVYKYLSALTAIAPSAPAVKQLVKKYSQ